MSIIKELGGLVTSQIIKQVSNSLGESESGIGKVIAGLAPTILAGMLNQSSNTSGFGKIFDMLGKKENVSYLDDLGGLIGGGNLSQGDPRDASGAMMGSIFGNKVGPIIDMISSIAGVKKGSSSSLMGMVGPMIMGYLGKKILNGGLNASGLMNLLSSERGSIADAIPNQLADLIGFDVPDTTKTATTAKIEEAASTGGNNLMKYLLPLLLVAGALFAWRSCGDEVKNAGDSMGDVVNEAANSVSDAASDVGDAATKGMDAIGDGISGLGSFLSRSLPGGVSLNVPENGIESQLLAFIEGSAPVDKTTWFNFDRINFNTGSANLDMDNSTEQLSNIAAILKAFPDVNIKLGGYTDNTGNEASNMTLSQNRANNVMAALTTMGIDAGRLAAEGYGIAHPVATNDTDEGRAQNRRIAVRVTKK